LLLFGWIEEEGTLTNDVYEGDKVFMQDAIRFEQLIDKMAKLGSR
jgi:hypothetical protein